MRIATTRVSELEAELEQASHSSEQLNAELVQLKRQADEHRELEQSLRTQLTELEQRLEAQRREHQQELEQRLEAQRHEHQQELEQRLEAQRREHQQELEQRLEAQSREHQQELERVQQQQRQQQQQQPSRRQPPQQAAPQPIAEQADTLSTVATMNESIGGLSSIDSESSLSDSSSSLLSSLGDSGSRLSNLVRLACMPLAKARTSTKLTSFVSRRHRGLALAHFVEPLLETLRAIVYVFSRLCNCWRSERND